MIFAILSVVMLTGLLVSPVLAVKPASSAGSVTVAWNLSADVMPAPPYGSGDIIGSDTNSKIIVNEPNGAIEAGLTGVMKDLNPNTVYTVYLSKPYTAYQPTSVEGTYKWQVLGTYLHDLVITTQNPDGTFVGTGGYPSGSSPYTSAGQTPETITGQVVGNTITFTTTYAGPYNPGYTVTVTGIIAADGSMSGTSPWEWHTTEGAATLASGSKGWPGLFTSTIQPFTFTTDEFGSGSWHINMRDDNFFGPGTYSLSVWINGGGKTVLVSDNFNVVVS